ncbi:MAG: hypothetical protein EHM28_09765 [Spirochaetaceae bacterium]|nr:MAG: hypothetical protein EHM28_09765 [Spirochaetaceae bacterium]
MKIAIPAISLIILFSVAGCAVNPGDVWIAVHWGHNDPPPDTLTQTTDIPGVPDTVAGIQEGGYYLTLPGTYTIQVDYLGPVPPMATYTYSFTLVPKVAIMGKEDNFYDLVIFADQAPICNEVPYFP